MDWSQVSTFLNQLNWQTIFALFAMNWYFSHDIRQSMKKLDEDVRASITELRENNKQQISRTDRLYQMFVDLLKDGRSKK